MQQCACKYVGVYRAGNTPGHRAQPGWGATCQGLAACHKLCSLAWSQAACKRTWHGSKAEKRL